MDPKIFVTEIVGLSGHSPLPTSNLIAATVLSCVLPTSHKLWWFCYFSVLEISLNPKDLIHPQKAGSAEMGRGKFPGSDYQPVRDGS
jgi:hypothetical protein